MAMRVQGGKMVPANPEAKSAVSAAATAVYKAAGEIGLSTQRLKRFVVDKPELAALIAEGDRIYKEGYALYKKLAAASR